MPSPCLGNLPPILPNRVLKEYVRRGIAGLTTMPDSIVSRLQSNVLTPPYPTEPKKRR